MLDINHFQSTIDAIESLEGLKDEIRDFSVNVSTREVMNFPPTQEIADICKMIQGLTSEAMRHLDNIEKEIEKY